MTSELDIQPELNEITWQEAWIKAISQPNEEAYQEIMTDPGASKERANKWILATAAVGFIISSIIGSIFGTGLFALSETGLFSTLICGVIAAPIFAWLGFNIHVGIINLIARALGGKGDPAKLYFTFAAFSAPLYIITSSISSVPFLNCLAILISLYILFLGTLSVKVAHQLDWIKAFISNIALALFLIGIAVAVVVFLAILGPAIGDVFSGLL